MIEREKKYLVYGDALDIRATELGVVGIAQWYTVVTPGYEERIRIMVDSDGVTKIYKTTKTDTEDAAARVENEIELLVLPDDPGFRTLPCVIKIRHILPTPQGAKEAVLDQYLSGPLLDQYILEIEADSGDIDEMARTISGNIEDVTGKQEYKNKNIATSQGLTVREVHKGLVRDIFCY